MRQEKFRQWTEQRNKSTLPQKRRSVRSVGSGDGDGEDRRGDSREREREKEEELAATYSKYVRTLEKEEEGKVGEDTCDGEIVKELESESAKNLDNSMNARKNTTVNSDTAPNAVNYTEFFLPSPKQRINAQQHEKLHQLPLRFASNSRPQSASHGHTPYALSLTSTPFASTTNTSRNRFHLKSRERE